MAEVIVGRNVQMASAPNDPQPPKLKGHKSKSPLPPERHHFKTGDVVQLNSGGPNMTLTAVALNGAGTEYLAGCKWFDANGVIHQGIFPVLVLRLAKA